MTTATAILPAVRPDIRIMKFVKPIVTDPFAAWMDAVDRNCYAIAGLSIHDLADMPFRDWFDDGVTPNEAARQALASEGFDEDGDGDDDWDLDY